MKSIFKHSPIILLCLILILPCFSAAAAEQTDPPITLRIGNWEEYIDEDMLSDFENWYSETYHKRITVEYSTFGTNEDLYNNLKLGDVYDLVCPSEYMIMKLMSEDALEPLSGEFFNRENSENLYINNVSPYIEDILESHLFQGQPWSKYMAGYMWGVTGFVYNPKMVEKADVDTFNIISNPKYMKQITLKDNVRDSYFSALGAVKSNLLTDPAFISDTNYKTSLEEEMNNTSDDTIKQVQEYLQKAKDNIYAFETDSGKSDMITGKITVNYQWSGDAVYIMSEASRDGFDLRFSVPKETTNIYFDGWVMLKAGVENDTRKQQACEAFINFISSPENAVRNMDYIGYTSVISGREDSAVADYISENYSASAQEPAKDYDLTYFFKEEQASEKFVIQLPVGEENGELFARYPTKDVLDRASIMTYFEPETNDKINQLWINVRCFNLRNIPAPVLVISAVIVLFLLGFKIKRKSQNANPHLS